VDQVSEVFRLACGGPFRYVLRAPRQPPFLNLPDASGGAARASTSHAADVRDRYQRAVHDMLQPLVERSAQALAQKA